MSVSTLTRVFLCEKYFFGELEMWLWCRLTHHYSLSLFNVDKPVVSRLTAWCANAWLGVHFVFVGAYLLLWEGSQKRSIFENSAQYRKVVCVCIIVKGCENINSCRGSQVTHGDTIFPARLLACCYNDKVWKSLGIMLLTLYEKPLSVQLLECTSLPDTEIRSPWSKKSW